ncbi:hypothetical protein BJX65DRAFT_14863 [Aspergillus insuetus]
MLLLFLVICCFLESGPALAMSMDYHSPYPHVNPSDPDFNSTCSSDPWWVKPIAVSLGMDAITAAYAYSDTNISVIAYLPTQDPDSNLTAYAGAIYELRQLYERTWNAPQEKEEASSALERYFRNVWREYGLHFEKIWSSVSGSWFYLRQAVDTSTSPFLAPTRLVMGYLAPALELATSPLKAGAMTIGLFPSAEADARYALRDNLEMAVVDALKTIRARALADLGIDISAAMVLYPDFLNRLTPGGSWWLQYAFERSCRQADIETMTYPPMSDKYLIQWSSASLWDAEAAPGEVRGPCANVIMLDQGLKHFDVMTSGSYCSMSFPVEGLNCTSVVYALISGNPNGNILLEELQRGASFNRLAYEIMGARDLLKAEHEASMDRGEDAPKEWPVYLDGWWVSNLAQSICLRWTDVKRVGDLYEDTLLDALHEAQSCVIQEANNYGEASNSTIDAVVILNSYCDAPLMTSAIVEALGNQTEMFGSTSESDLTYVAQVGARYALKKRDHAVKKMEYPCKHAHDITRVNAWYYGHGEL